MKKFLFDGTPEGIRRARQVWAVSCAIYFAHLAAFFVAPLITLFSEPGSWRWLAGMIPIVMVCVLDIYPQGYRVFTEELGMTLVERAFSLTIMSLVVGAALLMGSKNPVARIAGTFLWMFSHYMDLGPPPRLEKVSE